MQKKDSSEIATEVLLVEDELADKVIVEHFLSSSPGLRITHKAELASAVAFLQNTATKTDLILLDLNLPDSDGLDTFMALSKISTCPIVILSGLQDHDLAIKAVSHGAQDYVLKKDINRENLNRSVRYAIERHRLLMELSLAKENEHRLAVQDFLTGLSNRQEFYSQLDYSIHSHTRRNQEFALLFIDLDNFKDINDRYGHGVGDILLQEVAKRIRHSVRRCDIVSRIGGDEFTIILPDSKEYGTDDVLIRLKETVVDRPIRIHNYSISVSLSIGVSFFPIDGKDAETLVKHADIAMYDAKKGGKNNYSYFNKSIAEALVRRLDLEAELSKAVKKQQFELFYQPIISMAGNQVVGAEALIRWRHPSKGLMTPYYFIEIAEQMGIVTDIEKWVIETACRQYVKWAPSMNPDFQISINLSPVQFESDRIVDVITDNLKIPGVLPQHIGLEITERHTMSDVKKALRVMAKIQALNVNLIMDDFGAGYSSFSWICHFPINKIKIDKSFVLDLSNDKNATIIRTIVTLAKGLGLVSLAEGVETEEQKKYLQSLGCDQMQGYLLSKPLPVEDFERTFLGGKLLK